MARYQPVTSGGSFDGRVAAKGAADQAKRIRNLPTPEETIRQAETNLRNTAPPRTRPQTDNANAGRRTSPDLTAGVRQQYKDTKARRGATW